MKIMLVDDSRTIRNIQKKVLAQLGHSDIVEAKDGVEALEKYKESPPDLMLIDWNMPNMDGITLIRTIRQTDKTTPMIMCTTEAEKSEWWRRSRPASTTTWSSRSPPRPWQKRSTRPWRSWGLPPPSSARASAASR